MASHPDPDVGTTRTRSPSAVVPPTDTDEKGVPLPGHSHSRRVVTVTPFEAADPMSMRLYCSISMAPATLYSEVRIINWWSSVGTLTLLLSVAVIACGIVYKRKYEDAVVADEQGNTYQISSQVWLGALIISVMLVIVLVFEIIGLSSMVAKYGQFVELAIFANKWDTECGNKKLKPDAAVGFVVCAKQANRSTRLKLLYGLYLLLSIAAIGLLTYASVGLWKNGSHEPKKKEVWRWVYGRKQIGEGDSMKTVRTRQKELVDIVVSKECKGETTSYCYNLKLLNYFAMADLGSFSLWFIMNAVILYRLFKAGLHGTVYSIIPGGYNYDSIYSSCEIPEKHG